MTLDPPKRPLNIGHRGARDLAPENTLTGLLAGIRAGADGVEFDVQRTKDGHLVLFHDDNLARITGVRGLVVKNTLAQLKELNAGGHFGPQYANEPIPTLDEAIDCLPRDCFLNIEAKRKKLLSDGLERGIVEAVRRHNLYERVIVSSFNPAALLRIRLKDRRIPLGLLYETGMPFLLDTGWPSALLRRAALHPSWDMVTPEFVQKAHASGRRVYPWTVNESVYLQSMIDAGVDGIITDRPDILAQVLEQPAERSAD